MATGRLIVLIAGICLLLMFGQPVLAEDSEPIDVDGHGWMSLDHYTDKATRFPEALGPVQEESPPPPPAATDVSQSAPGDEEGTSADAEKTGEQALAQPVRPLNLPVMPGLNLGYDVRVTSTVEDMDSEAGAGEGVLAQPTRPLNLPVMPGLGLTDGGKENSDNNRRAGPVDEYRWQDAKTAARDAFSGEDEEREQTPLSVRFAGLPDGRMTSVPGAPVTKPHKKTQPAKETSPTAVPRNPEACAALTAYRQRQLAAIESDRQTLNALQAAIAEMGLDKKLDFMNGASDGLTASPKTGETAASEGANNGNITPASSSENKESQPH
ncbi:MAG: hypothetical protein PHY92_05610 [Alphaproteobacteria bacterium]|nr:hypothetical protein [Alphaproteobacteria bacterium]